MRLYLTIDTESIVNEERRNFQHIVAELPVGFRSIGFFS